MSVGKHVFSKTAHRIFLKLLMKLVCLKGKKLTELDFWGKSHFGDNAQNHSENRVLDFQKKSPLMCRFFWFKPCTIMTFKILLRLHVWKKSGRSDCRFLKFYYIKKLLEVSSWSFTYLLKLQIDVILGWCGQACPKTLLNLCGGPFSCDLLILLSSPFACFAWLFFFFR